MDFELLNTTTPTTIQSVSQSVRTYPHPHPQAVTTCMYVSIDRCSALQLIWIYELQITTEIWSAISDPTDCSVRLSGPFRQPVSSLKKKKKQIRVRMTTTAKIAHVIMSVTASRVTLFLGVL